MRNVFCNIIKSRFSQVIANKKHIPLIFCSYTTDSGKELKEYKIPVDKIRNFSIIAHVDHGKSTLADRILEVTGAIKRNSGAQVLDKLQVEKERGITVKAQTASLKYNLDGEEYMLNLIDTPGHVDFSSEVYRSLAACQGVILLVDANDGVQAQTVANFYLAFGNDLVIIPVINKIDLKNANPERVVKQLNTLFDIESEEILKISAKLGTGVDELLKAVITRIPPPTVNRDTDLRALIFDSWYDRYRGSMALIFIKDGSVAVGETITSVHTGKSYEVKTLSILRPEEEYVKRLYAGQVGALGCNMRTSAEAHIGDTLHLKAKPVEALPGFKAARSMVYAGVYPMDQSQYMSLKNSIDRLVLNDNAVSVTNESSPALGQGWRLGFLGLLHMEVFNQRLEQEFNAEAVITAPSVTYKAKIQGSKNIAKYKSEEIFFNNPSDCPNPQIITDFYEPMVVGTIITPTRYIGGVISLCMENRGVEKTSKNIDNERVMMQFVLPLNEIIVNFHDELKSMTSGYASFDYEDAGFERSNIVKLDIMLNSKLVEELSTMVHVTKARTVAKQMTTKLLDIIPRQQFLIAIQAGVGSNILSRDNIKPYRKDVTGKLYGGDYTRRQKLLRQQAEGKRKMRMIGNIALPRETFINVLKR